MTCPPGGRFGQVGVLIRPDGAFVVLVNGEAPAFELGTVRRATRPTCRYATRSDRTLLGAKGIATRSDRTLLGAPGIATGSNVRCVVDTKLRKSVRLLFGEIGVFVTAKSLLGSLRRSSNSGRFEGREHYSVFRMDTETVAISARPGHPSYQWEAGTAILGPFIDLHRQLS